LHNQQIYASQLDGLLTLTVSELSCALTGPYLLGFSITTWSQAAAHTFHSVSAPYSVFPTIIHGFPKHCDKPFDNKTESEEMLSVGCSSLSKLEVTMLWTIFVILLVLWLLGLVSSYTLGGFIHILLVVALVVLVINLLSGRRSAI
jgi:amino acid transporter